MSFDTGNSDPKRRGVLRASLEHLEPLGYDYGKPIGDINGTYAYLIKHQGRGLYLVARGSRPYKMNQVEFISSQRFLVTTAADEKRIILVSMWPKDTSRPWFRAFHARELRRRYAKDLNDDSRDNTRRGVEMLNYEWDLGTPIEHPGKLWDVLEKAALRIKEASKYSGVQPLDEVFGEDPTPLLHLCSKCGAQFSVSLEKCPGCGEAP